MSFILVDNKYRYKIEEDRWGEALNNKIVQLYDNIGRGFLVLIDHFDKEQNCFIAKEVNQPLMVKVTNATSNQTGVVFLRERLDLNDKV